MKLSTTARNAACNAVVDLADNGYVRIYSGSAPANPQTAASGTLLAELRFNATAFGAAATGAATANAFTADSSANADGTAGYARLLQSDGSTVIADCSVGTSGADINLNSLSISTGFEVQITSMTYTQPE